MPGVKLHHKTARNSVCTVTDHSRMFPSPYACPTCHTFHTYKTHHLHVDGVGDVTVAEDIYDWLKVEGVLKDGWEVLNTDRYPETLIVGVGQVSTAPVVSHEEAAIWP